MDKTGKFQYVNPEFVNITGYTLDEVPTGRVWFEKAFPDEELRRDVIKTWKENINVKKKNIERVYKIVCKNKEVKEIQFKAAPTESGETVTMLLDVTERRKAEELFRTLANNSPVGVYILEKEKIKFVNNYFKNITGFSDEELIDKNPVDMVYPEDRKKVIDETYKMLKNLRKSPFEFRIITKSGEIKWILQNIIPVQYMGEKVALASFLDISDAKQIELMLKESEERYRILTEKSPVGVYLIQDKLFRYVNQIFAEIVDYKPEEIVNKLSLKDFVEEIDGKPVEQVVKDIWDDRGDKGGMRLEISIRRRDGDIRYGEIHGSRIIYNGRPAVLGILIDVTEKKQMEEKLKLLSITDELTGVYNRRGFFTVSEQQFRIAKRLEKNMILFYLDLDNLKWINDNLGHKEGDNAIIAFVKILKNAFRESDIIGRLGGDEFAILTLSTGFDKPQVIIKRLNNLIDKYNNMERKPYKLSFSVGFVKYDKNSNQSLEELISIADDLMYIEKKRKKVESKPFHQFVVGNQ
ncbi:MAG TPA: PAS domain S-box protein [Syntrophorhabdaceae bacterium]|nr:PAS domain S-box protein [Syntrophorhabdaceae bacterium]